MRRSTVRSRVWHNIPAQSQTASTTEPVRMRTPPRVPEPQEIFAVHQERASGLSPAQIGLKHELSPVAIQKLLRPRLNTTLPTPFELANPSFDCAPASMYWLGFITGCGRVSEGISRTLVLSIDPRDVEHSKVLVHDLIPNHASYEYCMSNHDGQQLYIRDRDLGEAAAQWGLTDVPRATRCALEYVPTNLLPHFVRGMLEGQLDQPPFGGRDADREPLANMSRVTFQGSRSFTGALQRRLELVASGKDDGTRLVYQGATVSDLLRYAYRSSPRSSPRAAALVRAFTTVVDHTISN